jgi:hypothetical protein
MKTAEAIENHAIIGDLHTVALVALDGTIDFMCFPAFRLAQRLRGAARPRAWRTLLNFTGARWRPAQATLPARFKHPAYALSFGARRCRNLGLHAGG